MTGPGDLKNMINVYSRRLQKLKEQEAYTGINTRPHVIMEIEDIEIKLDELQKELAALDNEAVAQTQVESAEFDDFGRYFNVLEQLEAELKQLKERLEKLDRQETQFPTQNVTVTGNNNQVHVAGRDLSI